MLLARDTQNATATRQRVHRVPTHTYTPPEQKTAVEMAAHSIIKGRKMEDLLQLVLEADDDAGLSAALEQFYVLGCGLKKEFGAILKAFKVDGLVSRNRDSEPLSVPVRGIYIPPSSPLRVLYYSYSPL